MIDKKAPGRSVYDLPPENYSKVEDKFNKAGEEDNFTFAYAGKKRRNAGKFILPVLALLAAASFAGYLITTNDHGGPQKSFRTSSTSQNDFSGRVMNAVSPASGTPATPVQDVTAPPPLPAATTTTTTTSSTTTTPAPTPVPVAASAPAATTPDTTAKAAVTELPAGQTPAMPPALSPENGMPAAAKSAAVATAPGMTPAPDDSFPAVGGATASSSAGLPINSKMGAVTGTSASSVVPARSAAANTPPDSYYDSVPSPDMATAIGPRKLNPTEEPASKFIIVDKMEGSQGTGAQIVAADRALKLGHYDAAADMYDALYAKNPRDPRILMGKAVAEQNIGRTESALKTYDELLDIDHDNEDALLNMLGLLSKQYPEVALRRLINLHDKYPNNAMIAAQIGVTEGQQGQTDDAVRYLTMAVSMEPNNAQHQFNLAVIEDKAGAKDAAIKYYEQALETDAVYGNERSVPREQIYDRLSTLRQH